MTGKNLRDDQWDRIAHLLPGKPGDRGRTAADNRLFVEAVLWIAHSGATWRDLPETFGAWNSVYKRFARWQDRGVWQLVFDALGGDADFGPLIRNVSTDRVRQRAVGISRTRAPVHAIARAATPSTRASRWLQGSVMSASGA